MDDDGHELEIRLFGRFEIQRDGEPIDPEEWERKGVRTLLKVLLSKPGHVVSIDQIAEWILPAVAPSTARSSVQALVSRLRRVLEPELTQGAHSRFVQRSGEGYSFVLNPEVWLDTQRFASVVDRADQAVERGESAAAAHEFETALLLLRGDFLEEDRYEDWTLGLREEWRERQASVLRSLAGCYAEVGDYRRAASACRQAFEIRPWDESCMRQLMAYYYASGERSEALRVYARGTAALLDQLDVAPSENTLALHRRIVYQLPLKGVIAPSRTRLAVLPIVSIGGDPRVETIADGLTEQLIFALSQVESLRVIAQTSILPYKNSGKPASQIGRELGVGTLLEGSVRAVGDTARTTIQLIDAATEEHLWAKTYDWSLDETLDAQTGTANDTASALEIELRDADRRRMAMAASASSAGYALYLKGRHFLAGWSAGDAVECFEASISADPGFALAHAGLVDARCRDMSYGRDPDTFAKAAQSADDAIRLQPDLAEAQTAKALVLWLGERKLGEAEPFFRRALDLNPRCAMAHHWYGRYLTQTDRRSDAGVEFLRALEIDPLSPMLNMRFAGYLGRERRHEEAVYYLSKVINTVPDHLGARLELAKAKQSLGDWAGAENCLHTALEIGCSNPIVHQHYAMHLLLCGRTSEAKSREEQALDLHRPPYPDDVVHTNAGIFYFFAEEYERSLRYFEDVLPINPRLLFVHHWISLCYCLLGEYSAAWASLDQAEDAYGLFTMYPTSSFELWIEFTRGLVHARAGRIGAAKTVLRSLLEIPPMPDRSVALAMLCFSLDRKEDGYHWLKLAVEERDPEIVRILVFPMLKHLRSESEFTVILNRMGLPYSPSQSVSAAGPN